MTKINNFLYLFFFYNIFINCLNKIKATSEDIVKFLIIYKEFENAKIIAKEMQIPYEKIINISKKEFNKEYYPEIYKNILFKFNVSKEMQQLEKYLWNIENHAHQNYKKQIEQNIENEIKKSLKSNKRKLIFSGLTTTINGYFYFKEKLINIKIKNKEFNFLKYYFNNTRKLVFVGLGLLAFLTKQRCDFKKKLNMLKKK